MLTLLGTRLYAGLPISERDSEEQKITRQTEQRSKTIIVFQLIRVLCTFGLVAVSAYQAVLWWRTDTDCHLWLATRLAAAYVRAAYLNRLS